MPKKFFLEMTEDKKGNKTIILSSNQPDESCWVDELKKLVSMLENPDASQVQLVHGRIKKGDS